MATIANIESNTWGLSLVGYGVIAEGVALIRQSINIILRTPKGSDPLRPEFGSNVFQYVSAPINIAIPNIKKEIVESLEMWESRIKVKSIRHTIPEPHNPVFEIIYTILDEERTDRILFDAQAATVTSEVAAEILLQAFFPPNPNAYRYQLKLVRNSVEAEPMPQPGGYSSINEIFEWIEANWFFYGRWFLMNDRIVLYMNASGIVDATLSISIIQLIQVEGILPVLNPGETYSTSFKVNGIEVEPFMPLAYNTPGDLLFYAQQNWAAYGQWFIEAVDLGGNPIFSDEFSFEFDVKPDGYKLILVSTIEGFSGELNINIS